MRQSQPELSIFVPPIDRCRGMLDPNQGRGHPANGLFGLASKKFRCDLVRRIGEEERS
jgi:hypothetical protein